MLPDTAAQDPDRPWENRKRDIPLQTWSGRVVYDRKKKTWTTRDAERVLAALVQPASEPDELAWVDKVIRMLRDASLELMDKILFFLPDSIQEDLYTWVIGIMDRFFGFASPTDLRDQRAKNLILYIAQRAGFVIEFK